MNFTTDRLMTSYGVQNRNACIKYVNGRSSNSKFSIEDYIKDFRNVEKLARKNKDIFVDDDGIVITASGKQYYHKGKQVTEAKYKQVRGIVVDSGDEFSDPIIETMNDDVPANKSEAKEQFVQDIKE